MSRFPRARKFGITVLSGSLLWVDPTVAARADDSLRIATNVWPGYEPFHLIAGHSELADDLGAFEVIRYWNASEATSALEVGIVDMVDLPGFSGERLAHFSGLSLEGDGALEAER